MTVEIRSLRKSDKRKDFHSGDEAPDLYFVSPLVRTCIALAEQMMTELGCVGLLVDEKSDAVSSYRRYGFAVLEVIEGAAPQKPEPTATFLALGSVPPRE